MSSHLRRLWHLVQFQLAEALHQRVAWILAGAAVGVVLAGSALRSFNFGAAEPRFFTSVAQLVLSLTGSLLAALLGPALLGHGLATRTALVLFARGVRRAEWVLSSLAALWLVLGWLVVLVAAALTWLLWRHGHGAQLPGAWRALAPVGAAVLLVGAGAVLFAAIFERPVLAAAATLAWALAGQLAPLVARVAADSRGAEALAWRGLDALVPDFSALAGGGAGAGIYIAGYAAVCAAAAMLAFSRREL